MAWFAELKRRAWYCINGMRMDVWYWKQWYASLSSEQRRYLLDYKIRKEDKRKADVAIARLLGIGMAIGQMSQSTSHFI